MKRTLVVMCPDLHAGHRHGLLNPNTVLDEINHKGEIVKKYNPPLNPIQEYLWETYSTQIDEIAKDVGDKKNPTSLIVCFPGDLTAGNKYPQLLVSNRLADQVVIGVANLLPWFKIPQLKMLRIIKGTGAHTFLNGSSEILITNELKEMFPKMNIEVLAHSLLEVDSLKNDIAHHGPPPGSRKWLEGNEMRYYLRDIMMKEIMAGEVPPRIIWRGHYHTYIPPETLTIEAMNKVNTSTLVLVPSFCFIDDHARQVTKSPSRITHGMMVAEIVNGKLLDIIAKKKTIDIRTKEVF